MTTYGYSLFIDGASWSCAGFRSVLDAKVWCHEQAMKNGYWQPAALRERWWQFWRPVEHQKFEKIILEKQKSASPK